MNPSSIHKQLRQALQARGFSDWELSRRANVKTTLVVQALSGGEDLRVETLVRLARALDLELTLTPMTPEYRPVGAVPTLVDDVVMRLSPERVIHVADTAPNILALDLEGTLISSAVSMFVRPGLHRFLSLCRPLFERVVMFTTINEPRFRQIAATLVEEGTAPPWFMNVEYINWQGPTKDLTFVPGAEVDRVLLVDDMGTYIAPEQRTQWVPIRRFDAPFEQNDAELERVLEELAQRVFLPSLSAR